MNERLKIKGLTYLNRIKLGSKTGLGAKEKYKKKEKKNRVKLYGGDNLNLYSKG